MNYEGYCVRIDALDGYAAKLSGLTMCPDYKSFVAVRHTGSKGENPHYHLVIKTQVKDQAFRVRMRKIFDQGKGNSHMSIKAWDGCIDAISYLFHEDPDAQLLVVHNVSDETIQQARQRNKHVAALVLERKAKASWLLEAAVLEEIKALPVPRYGWTGAEIGQKLILGAFRSGKYVPQPWLLRAMAQRIQYALLNGDVEKEEELALRLARQVFDGP